MSRSSAEDYTWGHEVTLGIVQTYKELGGKVAKIIWNPIGTKDYGADHRLDPAGFRRRCRRRRRRRPHPPVRGLVPVWHG